MARIGEMCSKANRRISSNPAQSCALEETIQRCLTAMAKYEKKQKTEKNSKFVWRGARRSSFAFDDGRSHLLSLKIYSRLKLGSRQAIRCCSATVDLLYGVYEAYGDKYPKSGSSNTAPRKTTSNQRKKKQQSDLYDRTCEL